MTTLSSDLIGVKQTASLLHCSRSKVKKGYGPEPVMRFGKRRERLFRRSEVEAFKRSLSPVEVRLDLGTVIVDEQKHIIGESEEADWLIWCSDTGAITGGWTAELIGPYEPRLL